MHTGIKSRMVLRVIFFAPVVVSPVMVAFLWKYVYNPDAGRRAQRRADAIGLGSLRQDWLGNPSLAIWSVAVTVIWQYAGYSMVIFLAGLEGVPAGAARGGDDRRRGHARSASGTSPGRCSPRR